MAYRLWSSILAQYGQDVTLCTKAGERPVKAFFQPVTEKAPGEAPTPLGLAPVGKWLYLGPAGESLEDVEELRWEGRSFALLRHRGFPVGEETAYRWALAEEMDEVRP